MDDDLDAGELIEEGSLYEVVAGLDVFSKAKGDLGAADYHYHVGRLGLSVPDAAAQILDYDGDDVVQRVVGLQQYANSRRSYGY